MRPFGSKSEQGKALQLVQRGTDKRIPVELVKQPSGEVLDPSELEGLHVMVSSESGMEIATIPYTIEDKKLVVEVTADVSRHLGLGVYTMTATGRIPDEYYADGYHDYEIVVPLCKVTKYGSNETPVKVQANVLEGLKGDTGLSAYELAVKHGYQGTEEQFAKDIIPKSNYERAKELKGFQGTEEAYLDSLHGAPGESIYDIAVRRGFVGSEQVYLESQKGKDGKDAYQLYLETTTDNPKMTKAQYAIINATTTQYLYRINKGKDAPMNEQTLSADQLMELDSHRRNIINALREKGAQASDDLGLDAVPDKIRQIKSYVLTVHRSQQFLDWKDASLPPLKLSDNYRPADISWCFGRNRFLTKLPDFANLGEASTMGSFARECIGIATVTLPDIPKVKAIDNAFNGCTALTTATLGAMPNVSDLSLLFSDCTALTTATLGAMPKAVNAQGAFHNCGALERVMLDFTGGEITRILYLFTYCQRLEIVTGVIDLSRVTDTRDAFSGCVSLREVRLKGLKVDLDLSACANLSVESVKYLVDNLQQVTGKSITLHRDWQTAHPTEARAYAQKATAKGFALTFR